MKNTAKQKWVNRHDVLSERFGNDKALTRAQELLAREDQSEEAFLGAQVIMILHGRL